MAKKTAKKKKTASAKTARTKSLASKPPAFSISIQKILEKMKAIVDGKKEHEFLEECGALGKDRFVTVNARIVKLVKEFETEHKLRHDLRRTASFLPEATASQDDETCFEKP
jgi:hypothetical protein